MANMNSYLASLENLLVKNNTLTSSDDISSSLNKRVSYFRKGIDGMHDTLPIPKNLYPAIVVELGSQNESFNSLGRNGLRDIETQYTIACITDYNVLGEESTSREISAQECIQLTQNVLDLLRAYPRLSNTAVTLDSTVQVDYNARKREEYSNHVSNIQITVNMRTT